MLFIGGIVVTAFLCAGGMFKLRRMEVADMKASDEMLALGSRVWGYLTPAQQQELSGITSLLLQEEWIEEHVETSLLNGVSAERVLIELANRGYIVLGQGVFRKHASPLDYIQPNPIPEEVTTEAEPTEGEESAAEAVVSVEPDEEDTPIVILTGEDCKQCASVRTQPTEVADSENPKTSENPLKDKSE